MIRKEMQSTSQQPARIYTVLRRISGTSPHKVLKSTSTDRASEGDSKKSSISNEAMGNTREMPLAVYPAV
jgi:hypothetical protein